MADAMAMENPAAIATQFTAFVGSPWAKAGIAKHNPDIAMNKLLNFHFEDATTWLTSKIPVEDDVMDTS